MGCFAISTWSICAWKAEVLKRCCCVTGICLEPSRCARQQLSLYSMYYLGRGLICRCTKESGYALMCPPIGDGHDAHYLSEQMTHEVRSRDRAAFLLGIRSLGPSGMLRRHTL